MRNLPAAILAAAVAAVALWAIGALDDSRRPEAEARRVALEPALDSARLVSLYAEALRRDSSNPYRWTDLGDALAQNRRLPEARYCFRRALELNRRLPQIWLRDANFHFGLGENQAALASAALVLRAVPDYDGVLFNYFDRMIGDSGAVLNVIGGDPRSAAAYVAHLIAAAPPETARAAWLRYAAAAAPDQRVAAAYFEMLLRSRRYDLARADWQSPDPSNAVRNGDFEADPTGIPFDWRISPAPSAETAIDSSAAHDGRRALHIRFWGAENVDYSNAAQTLLLEPGTYELSAWVRTEGITTDQRPGLRIDSVDGGPPLHAATEAFAGTSGWGSVVQRFVAPPGTACATLRVVRAPSGRFDNKIAGDFWLDSVRLSKLK
jgi:tetratricopeptide (TPR) repeat protein